ncbi:MAG TPA: DMT family transporter [Candidatus Nanopelagicales bacterium]|nr:DMT family transporter [Candidatus Nanopelagicales bacterium]
MTTAARTSRHALRRSVAAVALIVAWSGGFIGAEFGTEAGAGPFQLLSWRFIVLSVLFLGACAATRTSLRSWAAWRRQIPLGALCQSIYLGLSFLGISLGVHGGTAALIAALQPLLVMTVAGPLLGEAPSRTAWFGTALGMLGVVIVVSGDLRTDSVPAWVYLLPTLAMLSLTVGTVLSRRLKPPEDLLQTITMQGVQSAVVLTVVALLTGQFTAPSNAGTYVAIGWMVLVPSIAGYTLYVYVTHEAGATVVSTLLYLTPPTTMIWAYVMFGDPITAAAVLGLAVSAVGVVLVLRHRRPGPLGTAPPEPAPAGAVVVHEPIGSIREKE